MFRKFVKKVRPTIREDMTKTVRSLASRAATRKILNFAYSKFSWKKKSSFHADYRALFEGFELILGKWHINFAGRNISLLLSPERAWLDWDLAVSALGHDVEIKQTYETLLNSGKLSVFFDIGANYGQHSLLLLAHGVRVVSFEPNPECNDYSRQTCKLNNIEPDVQAVALYDSEGVTELLFPENETWRGTIQAKAAEELAQLGTVKRLSVPQTTLDIFSEKNDLIPDLIKIDAEGAELMILKGGIKTLKAHFPVILFESWQSERDEILSFFEDIGYKVANLPLLPDVKPNLLSQEEFNGSSATNFAALPDNWKGLP